MIDFGTLENHRVITQSLNHAEWDLVRVFVRKLVAMTFGCASVGHWIYSRMLS
jgi:hypothetical protein